MIDFSIRNPLMVNLLLIIVLLLGVISWYAMPQEMFPVVEQDKVSIKTFFEGASPEEMERQVTLPIEQELDGLANIDVISSTSNESTSNILIELKTGSDVDNFMRKVRTALDQVDDLPEEAEEPELARLETRFPVISVSLFGEISRGELYAIAEGIKDELIQLPGVGSVGTAGDRDWEIWVVADPQVLAARGVSLNQIGHALQNNLRDLPGGTLKSTSGDIRLRGMGVPPDPEQIAAIVLRHNEQGGQLRLGELAQVQLRLEEAQTLGRFNGKPSVNLTINKTGQASSIEVAKLVHEFVANYQQNLPAGISLGLFSDLSVYVKNRLETVKSSGIIGLVLVLLALYLMLNFRVAFITALGIPVSFLVALITLYMLGYSINMVSLFAFLIALGLIVDDAIIVNENIYRHLEMGENPAGAAALGTKEVFWPVVASTTTTIAAFMPMFVIGGTMGAFISVIPVVVSASLVGSLLETFGVLPSHAKEFLRTAKERRPERIDWTTLSHRYMQLLRTCLNYRYPVAMLSVGVLAIVVTFAATRIPFLLFGYVDVGQFFVNVEGPSTYSIEDASRLADKLEETLMQTLGDDELETLLSNVGVMFIDFHRVKLGSRYIQLIVDLKKQKPEGFIERWISPLVSLKFSWEGSRTRSSKMVIEDVRRALQQIPGIQRFSILRTQGGPAGVDIEIGVLGESVDGITHTAETIRGFIGRLPGVSDARQDMDPGKLEYRYELNERGRRLGFSQSLLANAVRTGFLGLKLLHVSWRDKRIPVRLIYNDELRHDASALARLPITLDNGRTVYLGDVADIEEARGYNSINRRNLSRLATITAEVDAKVTTPNQVLELVMAEFSQLPAEQRLIFLGENKKAEESIIGMKRAAVIALAIIFFILAALFKSLLDPLVVMFAIPFGAIGVIVGHLLFGFYLQFLSLIGFLALTGIVVNDSLILIDFAKRLRRNGWGRKDALVEAGRVRIRPILLTSITTFLGISPLIFFATGQTAFLSPMAVSLGFGLLFATVLILFALPCFYLIADDMRLRVTSRDIGRGDRGLSSITTDG
ncbi:MAG: efflux RND transporter permease subunit [Candidatus Thiodiazotropha sp. (ex Lucinoma aequizonata)]|nr:efflux RND transporter permease subunit [Candidatus Thiodiazotropha sp. (ex Lucinoma aequizonata)]MCU7887950.1 efflux RND transporter permease subunit [Candidatus Thiodiazotropha sp. (ex Lucinoma aequizonata)]MCU7894575.1 efflux RND transporter permease subunit [Candidatus Thiodiazotropha sp. (ex Lucinoma aequizonata)]MCU7899836.1 efflux RND transporter permease subunit [Candidatus Thiodiazotropha sp. (ex Lucinoma aequizonata)]MCU7901165.1 efflux RND transporter permease subunit [Candidatus 